VDAIKRQRPFQGKEDDLSRNVEQAPIGSERELAEPHSVSKGTISPEHASNTNLLPCAEKQIRENERFLQAVFDGIQDGISVLDKELKILRINPTVERWYEHAMPIAGKKCYFAYHQRTEPCPACPSIAVLQTGLPNTAQLPIEGPQGVLGWLEVYSFPMFDEQNQVTGVIEYARDISVRKGAEAARRESDERLKVVMDNIPHAIFWKDRNLVYQGCNQQFAEDGGLSSPDEIIGKTALDMPWANRAAFYHSDDREVMESDLPKLNIEEPLLRADGTHRWLLTNKIPMHDTAGKVIGVLTTYEDITERKQMEQYMLHTERLAAMGRLAAALAHEVNNPLHAIGNGLELVLDFPIGPGEQREYLQAILLEIERLQALAGRVLDFARPPRLKQNWVSIPEIVNHSLVLSSKQLEHNNIEIELNLPVDLSPILASRDHLTQVFLNLIINAIEAMLQGGKLCITALTRQDFIELSFADTGPGIDPGSLALIFEPFYTTKEDGTGLGLSVSHSIIQQHGGNISARNTADGAVFIINLPIYRTIGESIIYEVPD
jgi:two-component system, cell cycle sensor histidine kinase and response regulator CckA